MINEAYAIPSNMNINVLKGTMQLKIKLLLAFHLFYFYCYIQHHLILDCKALRNCEMLVFILKIFKNVRNHRRNQELLYVGNN